MKKVLVTGATGMVGQNLQQLVLRLISGNVADEESAAYAELKNKRDNESLEIFLSTAVKRTKFYFSDRKKDGDLREIERVFWLFQTVKPTHVIHLAARVGGLFANIDSKV
jgi:nucleoside-diphosphate-sugar epimerase